MFGLFDKKECRSLFKNLREKLLLWPGDLSRSKLVEKLYNSNFKNDGGSVYIYAWQVTFLKQRMCVYSVK